MDEAQLMYRVDGQGRLRDVELCTLLTESILLHQQRHHVSSWEELHDQVQVDGILQQTYLIMVQCLC